MLASCFHVAKLNGAYVVMDEGAMRIHRPEAYKANGHWLGRTALAPAKGSHLSDLETPRLASFQVGFSFAHEMGLDALPHSMALPQWAAARQCALHTVAGPLTLACKPFYYAFLFRLTPF